MHLADKTAEKHKVWALIPIVGSLFVLITGLLLESQILTWLGPACFFGGLIYRLVKGAGDIDDRFDPSAQARVPAARVAGLQPHKVVITERSATFVWIGPRMSRFQVRGSWMEPAGKDWISAQRAIATVIVAYRLLSSSKAGVAADVATSSA